MRVRFSKNFIIVAVVVAVVGAVGAFGYLGFHYVLVADNLQEERSGFAAREAELLNAIKKLEEENAQLADALDGEMERNNAFERQIQSITSAVGVLEKLSQTDKELLQKYSRVYFLNENYVPKKLAEIDERYRYEKNRKMLIHADVQGYLYRMMDDAEFNGAPLQVVSAYRSFGEQGVLKTGYVVMYGSGSNRFSADQGYSEHQLGTAVDFTTLELGASFTKMESTSAYEWLLKNAYRYGFILSYPKGNAYYQFEPWHWRFVGVALANELHRRNQNFYDMPQREIDTYLVSLFD